jgi:hypothetical protein
MSNEFTPQSYSNSLVPDSCAGLWDGTYPSGITKKVSTKVEAFFVYWFFRRINLTYAICPPGV